MNKSENLTLIEGTFSDTDAKEILLNIFKSKIQFHELKNFSSIERFGKPDEIAINRIPALKANTDKILELMLEAQKQNKKLKISSHISISFAE